MRYYLDTEFIEYPGHLDLISIGMVSEDDRELYCVSYDFDATKASDWVKENVIKKLPPVGTHLPRSSIEDNILRFDNRLLVVIKPQNINLRTDRATISLIHPRW